MDTKIKYYKTKLLMHEFNDVNPLFQINKINDGVGINFSYSNEFPNVIQYMPNCDEYNSVILSIYKSIEPAYSLLENPTENSFLNITIFIEKRYIINLLGGDIHCITSTYDFDTIYGNVLFQRKWLEISYKWLENLEINLFSTKIPDSYIRAWAHQYLYELAHESYEMLNPSPVNNFKQEDIQKVRKLEIVIRNTPFKAIPSISKMAEGVGMSPTKFKKVFREAFGKSTHQYILDIKAEQAKKLLETNKFTITQVAYKVGFNHPSSLTRLIKKIYKVSPLKIGNTNSLSQRMM